MASAGTKRAVVKTVEISPLFILMLMEDYEARGGELVMEPAYKEQYQIQKQALRIKWKK